MIKTVKSALNIMRISALTLAVMLVFCACKQGGGTVIEREEDTLINTAEELAAFFESGTASKAVLAGSLDIGDMILTLTNARQKVTLDGGGYTLSGNADCIIRIADSGALTLNNITVAGGKDIIGCMGDADISGSKMMLRAQKTAINCGGKLTVGANSTIEIEAQEGYGITAGSLHINENSSIKAYAEKYAVNVSKKQLVMAENSSLDAVTRSDYSAVKCTGTLVLNDGASFKVKNEGSYHGAQTDYISINGDVTVQANGGSKGAGIFIFQLEEEYTVKGYCKSALRKENGAGNIEFDGE